MLFLVLFLQSFYVVAVSVAIPAAVPVVAVGGSGGVRGGRGGCAWRGRVVGPVVVCCWWRWSWRRVVVAVAVGGVSAWLG